MSTPALPLPELNSLQAILTDVDGTLYELRPVRRRVISRLFLSHLTNPVLGWKTIRCLRAFRAAQENIRHAPESDHSQPALQYAQAEQATRYSTDFVHQTVGRWMQREPLAFLPAAAHPGMHEFFTWAASRGIKLAALSDYPLDEKLRALGVADLFPVAVSADHLQVGRFKPHPAGLKFVLRQLNVAPGRALYLGDRPPIDGAAGIRAGIPAVILAPRTPPGYRDGMLFVPSFSDLRRWLEHGERKL